MALVLGVLGAVLAAPAAAAPQPVDRVERNGVMYTVYEERKPGDPNTYLYYVEDGALPGTSGGLRFSARQNGMESAAFVAATLLFAVSLLAVYRRGTMQGLLHG
ncbi:MAG TPA: hypothetical protein VNU01_04720 [Egibacteraceae bacterium]|nr:hypothetical protein [Egibacteraceae bacterium]